MIHDTPAHLTTCKTLREARAAVAWQEGWAGGPSLTYPICTYDPHTKRFFAIGEDMRSFEIGRGAYTEEAFAEFLASLPTA